jgi:hypothetical protein
MSMKNSNKTIVNRTHDLPACSPVSRPTAPPRTPKTEIKTHKYRQNWVNNSDRMTDGKIPNRTAQYVKRSSRSKECLERMKWIRDDVRKGFITYTMKGKWRATKIRKRCVATRCTCHLTSTCLRNILGSTSVYAAMTTTNKEGFTFHVQCSKQPHLHMTWYKLNLLSINNRN